MTPNQNQSQTAVSSVRPGIKFGRLIIENVSHHENGRTYWACQCECGVKTVAREDKLVGGRKKSCGCLQAESNRLLHEQRLKRIREKQTRLESRLVESRAKRKAQKESGKQTGSIGARFRYLKDLLRNSHTPRTDPLWSINFYEQLITGECYFCGGPLSPNGVSLSWINGSCVTANNAVPTCVRCLSIRGINDFSFLEMELLSPGLTMIQLERERNENA